VRRKLSISTGRIIKITCLHSESNGSIYELQWLRYTLYLPPQKPLTAYIYFTPQPICSERAVLVTAKQRCALANTEECTPTNNAAALYQPERMHPDTNQGDSKRWWIFVYFGAEQFAIPLRDFPEIGWSWIQQTVVERHRFQNHDERYHDEFWTEKHMKQT